MSLRWNYIVPPLRDYLLMKLDQDSRLKAVWSHSVMFNGTIDLCGVTQSTQTPQQNKD